MEEDTHELLHTWIERTKGRHLSGHTRGGRARTSQVHRRCYPSMLENTLGVLTKCYASVKSKIRHIGGPDGLRSTRASTSTLSRATTGESSLEAQAAAGESFSWTKACPTWWTRAKQLRRTGRKSKRHVQCTCSRRGYRQRLSCWC